LGEPPALNSLIDTIWDLRRKQERPLDPLFKLGEDVMCEVLLYVVSLWDIAESRAGGTEIIPRKYSSNPLVLMNVSRLWRKFITSTPRLWTYVLIDTDDEDVLEYLQVFFQLSRNMQLFIFLHGSAVVCDAIMADLLTVGDRIGALVYPPGVSLSTLAMFQFYLGEAHDQQIRQWYELEGQSPMQPQQHMNRYSFPTSIQNLWMDGLFLLSNLVTLSHFRSLSSLSVRLSIDGGFPPAHTYRLELPKLEKLRVHMAVALHHQVNMPILMICRNLKLLDLRYTLEVATDVRDVIAWMVFDGVDALEELQINLAIHVLAEVGLIDPVADEWLQGLQLLLQGIQVLVERDQQQSLERKQQLEQLERQVQQGLQELLQGQELQEEELQLQMKLQEEELELQELSKQELLFQLRVLQEQPRQGQKHVMLHVMLHRELLHREQREQRGQLQAAELLELELLKGERAKLEREMVELGRENPQQQQQRGPRLHQRETQLRFMTNIQKHWREVLSLPEHLEHLRRSSLKFMVTTRMGEEEYGAMRHTAETVLLSVLLSRLPQLTELTASKIPLTFPKHLQNLRLHRFSVPDSLVPINLPKLVSLEINADGLDHLRIMRHITAPQLMVLRVQVQDAPGELHKFDWRDTTSKPLEHISLLIDVPNHQQGNSVLIFQLPQTYSLNISSPHRPLCLCLTEPTPSSYTLHADPVSMLNSMGAPSRIDEIPANWQEGLITEWINPHYGAPSLAKFGTLVSLRRIVLDQRPYLLSNESPIDTLFKLLAENIHVCPNLIFITAFQCPSSWPRFLYQLRRRNQEAMLSKNTKCIEELSFHQPLHKRIVGWLIDAIMGKIPNVMERPLTRQGERWPMRPFEGDEQVFRSCYVCHITGMELGCLEYETRNVTCDRERGGGSKIYAC